MPLPQAVTVQLESQPSPSSRSPSSQASLPVRTLLPQAVAVQLLSQPSPFTVLASSHPSTGAWVPLPQVGTQVLLQPSPGVLLPSSQLAPVSQDSTVPSAQARFKLPLTPALVL